MWHTVIALESGCVLFETKAGPFDPNHPKDLAPWAPDEGSAGALAYLNLLAAIKRTVKYEFVEKHDRQDLYYSE